MMVYTINKKSIDFLFDDYLQKTPNQSLETLTQQN